MALVCLCHGVSERKVVKAIARGARTIDDVGRACQAGTCCHGCHDTIDALLHEHVAPVGVRGSSANGGRLTIVS